MFEPDEVIDEREARRRRYSTRVGRHSSLRLPRQSSLSLESPKASSSGSTSPHHGRSPNRQRRSESSASAFLGATGGGGAEGGAVVTGGRGGQQKSPSPKPGAFLRIRSFTLKLRHQRSSESHDSTISNASSGGAYEATSENMELLNSKNNGAVEEQSKAAADQNASIKGLWKWAFSSLRKDKPGETSTAKEQSKSKGRKTPKGHREGEDARDEADIDPVYHLLKCAANKGQYCATCGGPKQTEASGPSPIAPPNSGCSSPASASSAGSCAICKCPCHSPHRIPTITTKDIAPQRKKKSPLPSPSSGGAPGSFKGTSPLSGPTLRVSLTEDD